MDTLIQKPKLRNVNVQRATHQGEPVFLLQDGLRLTDATIVLPQVLGPFAMLCDGNHTLPELQAALEGQFGLTLSESIIQNLVEQFDQALLLDSQRFYQTKAQVIEEYRANPFRIPALAGSSYPADADTLRSSLRNYLDKVEAQISPVAATSRGIISPHIDYLRGGHVYAQVWASVAPAIREAELVIALGTDHNGNLGTLTLTPQNYASPLGVLPTDREIVNKLADILGPDQAFADELHHRGEHSLELVLIWLQFLREEKPVPVVPILTGSFFHFMSGQADIDQEVRYQAFIELLQDEMSHRRTVVIASGDLAHLGTAFGEPPMDSTDYVQMKADDDTLLENLCQGNAQSFFDFMRAGQFERNVCGLAPFYFTLSLLGDTYGQIIAYDRCPADYANNSYVSICGLVWE
jgi:AmmeMemoRadiSam system protein B